jgi:hypothetical protein
MKTLLTVFCGMMMAAIVHGAADEGLPQQTLQFRTEGPDAYADGTPVVPGETYALVYVKAGGAFQGVRPDGTLVSPDNVVVTTSVATDEHRCLTKQIQYPVSLYPAGGQWLVVLLDTRSSASSVGGLVAASSGDGAGAKCQAGGGTALGTLNATSPGGGLASTRPAAVPEGIQPPVITGIAVQGGGVHLTVANCTNTTYVVESSADMGTWQTATANEADSRITPLGGGTGARTVPLTEGASVRFFKVVVPR